MSVTREVAFPQSVSKQDKTESRSERPQDRLFVNFIVKTKLESEGRDPVQTPASREGSADTQFLVRMGIRFPTLSPHILVKVIYQI